MSKNKTNPVKETSENTTDQNTETTEVTAETTQAAETVTEETQSVETATEETKTEESDTETKETEATAEEVETEQDDAIKPYLEAYPDVDTFYRTSDGQVFTDQNLGGLHARTLGSDNKLQTIKR
jgi:hypothetical protein